MRERRGGLNSKSIFFNVVRVSPREPKRLAGVDDNAVPCRCGYFSKPYSIISISVAQLKWLSGWWQWLVSVACVKSAQGLICWTA